MNDVMDTDKRNALGRRIRIVLKHAPQPMTVEEIAARLKSARSDVYEALSVSLHGWVSSTDNKFRLL